MMKVIRGGVSLLLIYLLAVSITLIVSNRVEEIDSTNGFRNSNSSLSLKLKK